MGEGIYQADLSEVKGWAEGTEESWSVGHLLGASGDPVKGRDAEGRAGPPMPRCRAFPRWEDLCKVRGIRALSCVLATCVGGVLRDATLSSGREVTSVVQTQPREGLNPSCGGMIAPTGAGTAGTGMALPELASS